MITHINGHIVQALIRYIFETDPTHVTEIHITPGSITVEEYLVDAEGNLHASEVDGQMSTRVTHIPITYKT